MPLSSDRLIKAFRLQSAYQIQPPVRASDRLSQFLASKKIIPDVGSDCESYIVGECGIIGPGCVGKAEHSWKTVADGLKLARDRVLAYVSTAL